MKKTKTKTHVCFENNRGEKYCVRKDETSQLVFERVSTFLSGINKRFDKMGKNVKLFITPSELKSEHKKSK